MDDAALTPIRDELAAEYGEVVPDSLLTSTVTAAWAAVPTHDDAQVRELARTDVAALAEAVLRRPTDDAVSA